MQDLIIFDTRLMSSGLLPFLMPSMRSQAPRGKEVMEVGPATALSQPIDWVVAKSAQYAGDVRVRIMAHGAGVDLFVDHPVGTRGTVRIHSTSQGGVGLFFCSENLFLKTIPRFAAWRDKVKQIDLMGCAAAYITKGYEGKIGDGNLLCMQLAQVTQSRVRASTAEQLYVFKGPIDFGSWEGTVLTYGPAGQLLDASNSPSN